MSIFDRVVGGGAGGVQVGKFVGVSSMSPLASSAAFFRSKADCS